MKINYDTEIDRLNDSIIANTLRVARNRIIQRLEEKLDASDDVDERIRINSLLVNLR